MSLQEGKQTVVLVTGANRGIGLGLTTSLLLRPNHTVIATIRNSSTPTLDLLALPKADGSDLIIVHFDIPTDIKELENQGACLKAQLNERVGWIDTVISCAGGGWEFESVKATGLESLMGHFALNCAGTLVLFHATRDLLLTEVGRDGEGGGERKFILISSSLGAIGEMEGAIPSLAYGVGKAGANYLLRKLAFEEKGMVAVAIHPGWVKTENGQNFADSIGVTEPPMSSEESVMGVLAQIDNASKATTGTFVSYDGTAIKW